MRLKFSRLSLKILSLFVFFGFWQLISFLRIIPVAIPSPIDIAFSFVNPHFTRNIVPAACNSLVRVFAGLGTAILVAVPLGMISGWFSLARDVIDPIVELFRPIPPIAWVGFALILFRSDLQVSSFIIFIGAFFPIFSNTFHGFSSVSVEFVDVARSFGAREKDLLLKVAFPSALPDILVGVRVGLGVGWMCVIAAEMIGASGLGWMMNQLRWLHNLSLMMAYMFAVGALGFIMERVFRYFESVILKWRRGLVRG